MLKNTSQKYGKIAKYFHWIIAILIITLLIAGFVMINLPSSAQKWQIYGIHKATGILVLSLVCLRFIWKLVNTKVMLAHDMPVWMKFAANISHKFLYLLMFIMPISGTGMSLFGGHDISFYGLFNIKAFEPNLILAKLFAGFHFYSSIFLVFLITIHVMAAMYHHFIMRDDTLQKMISK